MRWVNIGVIIALVAVILIFALQNLESVTMSFLGFRISARRSLSSLLFSTS